MYLFDLPLGCVCLSDPVRQLGAVTDDQVSNHRLVDRLEDVHPLPLLMVRGSGRVTNSFFSIGFVSS